MQLQIIGWQTLLFPHDCAGQQCTDPIITPHKISCQSVQWIECVWRQVSLMWWDVIDTVSQDWGASTHLSSQNSLQALHIVTIWLGLAPQPEKQPQTGRVTFLLALDVSNVTTEAHPARQSPPALTDLTQRIQLSIEFTLEIAVETHLLICEQPFYKIWCDGHSAGWGEVRGGEERWGEGEGGRC